MNFRINIDAVDTIKPARPNRDIHVGITHGGKFHADDCIGAAILILLTENDIEFDRVTNAAPYKDRDNTIIFDIGGGEFDHHQKNAEMRQTKDGYPHKYAAAGLLWRKFGEDICGDPEVAALVDNDFMRTIDMHDNGEEFNMFSLQVGKFSPVWYGDEDLTVAFGKAVRFCLQALTNCIKDAKGKVLARDVVKKAIAEQETPEIVVFDKSLPAMEYVVDENERRSPTEKILYMIAPSSRGNWSIPAVGVKGDRFAQLLPFPEEWRGKSPEELAKLTNGLATFVHPTGFTASADTKENAIALANLSIKVQTAVD